VKRELMIALAVVVGGAAIYMGCQPLPEWPAFEASGIGGSSPTGTNPSPGTAGSAGSIGATGVAGSQSNGIAGSGSGSGTGGTSPVSGSAGTGGSGPGGSGPSGSAGNASSSGTAGTSALGGSGGSAAGTSGGMAGSAATDPLAEAKLALANLDNFTWTKSCKFSDSGKDVTVLSGCQAADVCWETADLGRTSESKTIEIRGVAGHSYKFDLRLRGVLEPRDYPVAPNCTRLPNMPADTVGASECQDGYANKAQVTFNVMELAIPMPARKYYMNSVPVHPPHRVDKADWKWTVTVAANQTIRFSYDDLNGGMIRNCNNSVAGADILVKMQPYNGQWFQLNVDYTTLQILQ
jgi:hypothetical protein